MESAEPRADVHDQPARAAASSPSTASSRAAARRASMINIRHAGARLASQAAGPKLPPPKKKDDVSVPWFVADEATRRRVDDRLQLGFPMAVEDGHRRRGREAQLAKFERQDEAVHLGPACRRDARRGQRALAGPSAPSFCRFATILRKPRGRRSSGIRYAIARARSTTPYENFSSGSSTIAAFPGVPGYPGHFADIRAYVNITIYFSSRAA